MPRKQARGSEYPPRYEPPSAKKQRLRSAVQDLERKDNVQINLWGRKAKKNPTNNCKGAAGRFKWHGSAGAPFSFDVHTVSTQDSLQKGLQHHFSKSDQIKLYVWRKKKRSDFHGWLLSVSVEMLYSHIAAAGSGAESEAKNEARL